MTRFPNKAGDHADTDDILRAELKAAGIPTVQEAAGEGPEYMAELFRSTSGEVKTSVIGVLHGWEFKRAWYYWIASGPGIEVAAAERLHATNGQTVRVAGHCGCPSPREWFKGLACGSYHVDDAAGLKALADTIRKLVEPPGEDSMSAPTGIEAAVCQDIADRQQLGIRKYGTTVAANPLELREWLQHAYEECLDQAVYLRRAIAELPPA